MDNIHRYVHNLFHIFGQAVTMCAVQ